MTKEQHNNQFATIKEAHEYLKKLVVGDEEGMKHLSNMYDIAGINLEGNFEKSKEEK